MNFLLEEGSINKYFFVIIVGIVFVGLTGTGELVIGPLLDRLLVVGEGVIPVGCELSFSGGLYILS